MAGSSTNQEYRKTYAYKRWSIIVRRLFGKCQCCGSRKSGHAHHIKKSADYPELRVEPSNGVRLCKDCHEFFHVDVCGGYGKPAPSGALEWFLDVFGSRGVDYRRAKRFRTDAKYRAKILTKYKGTAIKKI